ncbi:hypothetical protein [Kineococcus radiotolerans]|uniref:Secreted protein/lipoprotein n=1 Tax=Kineococcus radiotolerans (strain ATCC BAA-149 / DSM 14245 / SRS30216) TaxID=266940 RepID=A6WH10_KINRD|nr:hypothetical protein [Kineococcus radiotolerans]ABS06099.1 hypothetical protein Krad_4640 [Kineococcus radiotolerans SRS30216 = ATCC BAA-149]
MQRFTTSRLAAASAAVAVLLLAGCGNNDDIDFGSDPQQGSSSTSSPTPSVDTEQLEQQKVLEGYNAYWTTYDATAAQPSPDKAVVSQALTPVAVDPALDTSVNDIVNAALAGQKAYGNYVVDPKTPVFQNEEHTEALVTDCIDSSQSGWEDATTGQKLTVGVPAVSSKATLVKGDDGTWRMSQVTFDDTVTCS